MTTTTTTGTIAGVFRLKSSANGNPRFRVDLTDGREFTTAPDSMVAYAIDGADFLGSPARGIPAPRVRFTLDSRARIIGADILTAAR